MPSRGPRWLPRTIYDIIPSSGRWCPLDLSRSEWVKPPTPSAKTLGCSASISHRKVARWPTIVSAKTNGSMGPDHRHDERNGECEATLPLGCKTSRYARVRLTPPILTEATHTRKRDRPSATATSASVSGLSGTRSPPRAITGARGIPSACKATIWLDAICPLGRKSHPYYAECRGAPSLGVSRRLSGRCDLIRRRHTHGLVRQREGGGTIDPNAYKETRLSPIGKTARSWRHEPRRQC